jgi:hypothetical protein
MAAFVARQSAPLRISGLVVFVLGAVGFLGSIPSVPAGVRVVLSWLHVTPSYNGVVLSLIAFGVLLMFFGQFVEISGTSWRWRRQPQPFPIDLWSMRQLPDKELRYGADIWAKNTTPNTVRDLSITLTALSLWSTDHSRFVDTHFAEVVAQHGPLSLPQLLSASTLQSGGAARFGFMQDAGTMLAFSGTHTDGATATYRISLASGVYRGDLRIGSSLGQWTLFFCFRTDYLGITPLFFSDNPKARPRRDELKIPEKSFPSADSLRR